MLAQIKRETDIEKLRGITLKLYSELQATKKELKQTKAELKATKLELTETKAELERTKIELAETKAELAQTKAELQATRQELSSVKDELAKLKLELAAIKTEKFGSKSEKTKPPQTLRQKKQPKARTVTGRTAQPLLDVRTVVHDLDNKACPECQKEMTFCKTQITEKIDAESAKVYLVKHQANQYECDKCQILKTAKKPPNFLERGRYSTRFVIMAILMKYRLLVPYERQVKEWATHNLVITTNVFTDCEQQMVGYFELTLAAMNQSIKKGEIVHVDETRWKLYGNQHTETRRNVEILVLTNKKGTYFSPIFSEKGATIKANIAGISTALAADGLTSYKTYCEEHKVRLFSCWAHARRYFKPFQDRADIKSIWDLISKMYHLNKDIHSKTPEEQQATRDAQTNIVDQIFNLLKSIKTEPRMPLHRAVNYCLKREVSLRAFLSSPIYPLDNNAAENAIRPVVLGRKSSLCSRSPKGMKTSCDFYSLIRTCQTYGIDAFDYLLTIVEMHLKQFGPIKPNSPKGQGVVLLPQDYLRLKQQNLDLAV
jgi:transposase